MRASVYEIHCVCTCKSGLVLMLSRRPHVLEGDGLAVRVEGVGVEEGEGVRVADARLSC